MIKSAKSLLNEYGIKWIIYRGLYTIKLQIMSIFPMLEYIFEKKVKVKRLDIFNFNVRGIKDFLKELSEEKKSEIINIADKAVNGIITGFSSIELNYGNPINWHLNPITGIESNKYLKWYRIPDFDTKIGDIKIIWEASRFTHFLYFARAYLLTENKKYYNAFSIQLEDWLKNNPYSYGVNYKCGQECALRMINALMAYKIFKDMGCISQNDEKNLIKLVELCYKKILSNFFYAQKCIKNNHIFSEICGLIIGAWCCQDELGIKKGYKLLNEEIKNQFQSDGGFIQYSFNYQRFVMQIIECIYKISEKTGIRIIEEERLKNSVILMYQMQDENGDVPNYGSNDGSLIFPVTTCGYRDFRPILNTVYALIKGERLYEHGDYDEELLWFGRKENLPISNIKRKSSIFNDSGYYILRHDNGFLMTCLQKFISRPAHMDQLHIDLWHKGINLFCDSGTYSYASNLGKELSLTSGHNTVKCAGKEQMNKRGTFLVFDWTKRQDIEYDYNSFKGTMISQNGYKHTRIIKRTNLGYMVIDEVKSNYEYCEFYFHTPCEVKFISDCFELHYKKSIICIVEVSDGELINKKAYRSLYYLKKEECNCVVVRCKMNNNKCEVKFNIKLINN